MESEEGLTTGNWIAIAAIVLPLGVTMVWGFITLVFRSGKIITSIEFMGKNVESIQESIKPLPLIEDRVNELWRQRATKSDSPIKLNDFGQKILEESNIGEFTEKYYSAILEKVKVREPANAYQAQEILIDEVSGFKGQGSYSNDLENAAFNSGTDVDTVLLVAAVDVRDKVLKDLGFNRDDIDRHDPKKKAEN